MIDIHSHIIFGVDDGASTIDESMRMIGEAERLGIKTIIATPHFHEEVFKTEKVKEHYQELVKNAAEYNVTLKLGYEIFLNPSIPQKIDLNGFLCLDGSKYALVEFPFDSIPYYMDQTMYKLQVKGIIPIIAHPERNRNLNRDLNRFISFIERGCLAQVDAGSIAGIYGRQARAFARHIIKLNMVHFVASDAHCSQDYIQWYEKAYKKTSQWVGKEGADKLFYSNARTILDDVYENVYATT